MKAESLFHAGVKAIQTDKDIAKGQQLLEQAVKGNPNHDMAWVWLARTINDRARQIEMLERALSINPDNQLARQIMDQLVFDFDEQVTHRLKDTITYQRIAALLQPDNKLTTAQQERIKRLMQAAEKAAPPDKLKHWLAILKIQTDHEAAMRHAVQILVSQGNSQAAGELLHRAIDAGTTNPAIYFTAMDFARRLHEDEHYATLRNQLFDLGGLSGPVYLRLAQTYLDEQRYEEAQQVLKAGIRLHPDEQALLFKMGDLLDTHFENKDEARIYYHRAATNPNTEAGQEADKRLANYAPIMTDRERGSLLLAMREAAGFPLIYFMLAWQDAGVNLSNVDVYHWAGVLLSVFGGYLLITATSSPQQTLITKWLGGKVPVYKQPANLRGALQGILSEEPTRLAILSNDVRFVFGGVGLTILLFAFLLVFSASIKLLLDPVPINVDWWYY